MLEARYDEFGQPLIRSGVGERIWAFYQTDPARFKQEVVAYVARGYPHYSVVSANYKERVLWLKDERRRTIDAQQRDGLRL